MTGESTDTETTGEAGKAPATVLRETRTNCPNCGAGLEGPWCHRCGQSQKPIDRFFFAFVAEAFEDVFSWDSRAARTLVALLFRPGFLTLEYFAGRRARSVQPLRLYIIASVLFFFVLSVQSIIAPSLEGSDGLVSIKETPKSIGAPPAASSGNVDEQETEASDDWEEDLQQELDQIEFKVLSDEANEAIRSRLKTQTHKFMQKVADDPRAAADLILDTAPPLLFIFLPIFALLLKLTYLGSGRFYTEHLVLAVHNHCFLFVILTAETILDAIEGQLPFLAAIGPAIHVWIQVYLYLSLRRVYNQGYIVTFFKYLFLGFVYLIFLMIGLVVAFLFGVLTL